ncbi:MAG: helix-turn-helix domain-containing protein [Gammaproteobacteria bacterium]|nr:helix-turn-helix domain-containing protein [Gammaproteobacteria bacterium]
MNPEDGQQDIQPPIETPGSVGQILRRTRESRQLSVEDVASMLKLHRRFISALENDRYDELPGHTFAKGYVRSYSTLLKLDPRELIGQLQLEPEVDVDIKSRKAITIRHGGGGGGKSRKVGKIYRRLLGFLVFTLALGLSALYVVTQWFDEGENLIIENLLAPALNGQDEDIPSADQQTIRTPNQSGQEQTREVVIPIE